MTKSDPDKKNLSTVWLTNRVLSVGIEEILIGMDPRGDKDLVIAAEENSRGYRLHYRGEGKNWHRTRAGAVARANEIRDRKIDSLERQLMKLRGTKF